MSAGDDIERVKEAAWSLRLMAAQERGEEYADPHVREITAALGRLQVRIATLESVEAAARVIDEQLAHGEWTEAARAQLYNALLESRP